MIGKQILNYKIDSLIGEGGMGNVYLAKHIQLEREVAIKMLHPRFASNTALKSRFKNEAVAMSSLNHPNIVGLHDYLESDDGLFLIMEYVQGKELDKYIRDESGPINEKDTLIFMKQILEGFAFAHKKGIVHRDIKPSNIIFTPDKKIKILDFGIAKLLDVDKNLTKTGTQMGTVLYMSPEQVRGEVIDQRTDIYSLGVTLFQMLTGRSPYSTTTTEFEIYTQIVNEPLPKASSIYPGVSSYFEDIIAKATAKDRNNRFDSCEDMLNSFNSENPIISPSKKPNTISNTNAKTPFAVLKQNRAEFSDGKFVQIAPEIDLDNVATYLKKCFGISPNDFVEKYGKVQLLCDFVGRNKFKGGILFSSKALFIVQPNIHLKIAKQWKSIKEIKTTISKLNNRILEIEIICYEAEKYRTINLICANLHYAKNLKKILDEVNTTFI